MCFLKLAVGAGGMLSEWPVGGSRSYCLLFQYYLHSPTGLSTLVLGECV